MLADSVSRFFNAQLQRVAPIRIRRFRELNCIPALVLDFSELQKGTIQLSCLNDNKRSRSRRHFFVAFLCGGDHRHCAEKHSQGQQQRGQFEAAILFHADLPFNRQ